MNTKSKHTPGPWEYRPNKYDDWGVVRSADGLPVAQACVGRWYKDFDAHRVNKTDPGEANARLIAAAPDLLDALEMLISNHDNCGQPRMLNVIPAARAAIAKAKGDK